MSGAKLAKGRPISCRLLPGCSSDAAFAESVERAAKQLLALPRVLCRRRGGFGFGRGKAVETREAKGVAQNTCLECHTNF
ncbi:hypothetical protein V6N12_000645 [Hibiscus sabdariffa]|uniref:Uncharacterized protein n=1 Tax=Hibiscus sabdariffa TaxID=183260 RepID=A0ABR2AJR1_9ROSI